jgi:hypothetical protein
MAGGFGDEKSAGQMAMMPGTRVRRVQWNHIGSHKFLVPYLFTMAWII